MFNFNLYAIMIGRSSLQWNFKQPEPLNPTFRSLCLSEQPLSEGQNVEAEFNADAGEQGGASL